MIESNGPVISDVSVRLPASPPTDGSAPLDQDQLSCFPLPGLVAADHTGHGDGPRIEQAADCGFW